MNRKCAILNKVNFTNDEKELKNLEKLLVLYCKEKLKINNYEVFSDRKELENKILTDEYTDLLVYDKKQFSISLQGIDLHYLKESEEQFKDFIYYELYKIIRKYTNSLNIRCNKDTDRKVRNFEETAKRINVEELQDENLLLYYMNSSFARQYRWRKTKKEDIEKSLKNPKTNDILTIEDHIANKMFDLLNSELDEIFTDEKLLEISNDKNTSEELREWIKLYFKSNIIFREVRNFIY